jgi:hypothetical protein
MKRKTLLVFLEGFCRDGKQNFTFLVQCLSIEGFRAILQMDAQSAGRLIAFYYIFSGLFMLLLDKN